MAWQAFLDLSSAGGTFLIPCCKVLPWWVIFTGVYQQGLPLGDWKVMGRLVCWCGVWECQSWMGSWAQERKEEEEESSPIFPDVGRQALSIISPQGAKTGYEPFVLPRLKFSMSALAGCFFLGWNVAFSFVKWVSYFLFSKGFWKSN